MMKQLNIGVIKNAVLKKGYKWFDKINIVWIRSNNKATNTFDDFCTVTYIEDGIWKFIGFKGTTDPGLYWLNHPENPHGTAILKPGQYIDCWEIGDHHGHPALVQVSPMTVYRDNNRDGELNVISGSEDTGLFGINSHRANPVGESVQIDKWSAGCQVIAKSQSQDRYLAICRKSDQKYFTNTLLLENDL